MQSLLVKFFPPHLSSVEFVPPVEGITMHGQSSKKMIITVYNIKLLLPVTAEKGAKEMVSTPYRHFKHVFTPFDLTIKFLIFKNF